MAGETRSEPWIQIKGSDSGSSVLLNNCVTVTLGNLSDLGESLIPQLRVELVC